MSYSLIAIISIAYLALLFVLAHYTQKSQGLSRRFSNSSLVYALSLGVFCTAWTFYGSIGKAASSGLMFLAVYLGPTLIAPLWMNILKKVIHISNYLRITSIADFISSRYGKSTSLGVMVSLLCLLIVIPYISIQLKALEFTVSILHDGGSNNFQFAQHDVFYTDPAMLFAFSFALFAIVFGTRKLDPSEKHPGVVNVMAIESVVKLVCFLIGAVAIVYFVFDGIEDIFTQSYALFDMKPFTTIGQGGTDYGTWACVVLLSASAFLFLPRQFHMAVVENNNVDHVERASWITPSYLLLISIFVLPVAFAGKILFGQVVEPDTFLLSIPIDAGMKLVSLIVFVGGLAAVSGMIIISMISLSIMISNNIFLPFLLKIEKQYEYLLRDLNTRLLQMRRILIVVVMLLSYGFYKAFSINYSIVSVGLISFAGVSQLAPLVIFGMYWKYSTAKGAMAGFLVGTFIWAFTLPIANLMELGVLDPQILERGLFGWSALRPTALFGLTNLPPLAHGTFWSLFGNIFTFLVVSLSTQRNATEIAQSDIFLNPEKYFKSNQPKSPALERKADLNELKTVLKAILGEKKLNEILDSYFKNNQLNTEPEFADSDLINHIESFLSGSIGAASANIVLNHIVEQKPVNTGELIDILDQTYQVHEYSHLLEVKSKELSERTRELKEANERLTELDQLKNEFISNVTHELRTPITSIRSLSSILNQYDVTDDEKSKFLNIISDESERISELVNQVLDLRKLEVEPELSMSNFDLKTLVDDVVLSFKELKGERLLVTKGEHLNIQSDQPKLKQVLINLVNNAIKFTDEKKGKIEISWKNDTEEVLLEVKDNGKGISKSDQSKIFNRFYQGRNNLQLKTKGSGLGLSISKSLIEALDGEIWVSSEVGSGSIFKIRIKS